MAEGRMLKKRISKSKKFALLKTNDARMMYLLILAHVDRDGRIDADPLTLKGEVFPLVDINVHKIQAYLEDMKKVGLINLYTVGDSQYLQITRFHDFNKLNHYEREAPSHIPNQEGTTPGQVQDKSGITPPESKVKESKEKELKERERKEKEWKEINAKVPFHSSSKDFKAFKTPNFINKDF